jgi:hypothetical protein
MINFDEYRNKLKEIKGLKKHYDSFIKKNIIQTLKQIVVELRDELDTHCDEYGILQVNAEMNNHTHIYTLDYQYSDTEYNYPRKFSVITLAYFPGGDVDIQINLFTTNSYRGELANVFVGKVIKHLSQHNIFELIYKKINSLTPMVRTLKKEGDEKESEMWKQYRGETTKMVELLYSNLLNGETITLTEPTTFTFGSRVFFANQINFVKPENKNSGELKLLNTLTGNACVWVKYTLNSLSKTCRDIAHYEREL